MELTQMYISEFVGTAVLLAFGNSTLVTVQMHRFY